MVDLKIKDIMTKNVKTVNSNDPVSQAATLMQEINVGSIPVVEGKKVVGIVTDRDIVLRNVANEKTPHEKISSVMTKNLISVSPETDIHEAAHIMAKNQIRRLPVINNEELMGIVSIGDLAVEEIFENEAGEALHDISQKKHI